MSASPTPVLYLDIDGTVRHGMDELGHFVNCIADVKIFPDALKLMRKAKAEGHRIVGISNQGGIALGHLTMKACIGIMFETQKQCDGLFDKIAWCQHHPNAKDPEMAECWCRKPRIGLIVETMLDLAQHTNEYYPPAFGLFVGDRAEDKECAANAGLRFMWAADWRATAIESR